jgi:hypothetical protein
MQYDRIFLNSSLLASYNWHVSYHDQPKMTSTPGWFYPIIAQYDTAVKCIQLQFSMFTHEYYSYLTNGVIGSSLHRLTVVNVRAMQRLRSLYVNLYNFR